MSDYIELDDPAWIDKMMALSSGTALKEELIHPWDGIIVVSKTNALRTARVSVTSQGVTLNFGWDSPQSRYWRCAAEHLSEHYRVL